MDLYAAFFFFQYHLPLLHAYDVTTFPAPERDAFNTSTFVKEISSQIRNAFRLYDFFHVEISSIFVNVGL